MKYRFQLLFLNFILLLLFINSCTQQTPLSFSGNNALNYIQNQVAFGPRIPGSTNSYELKNFISNEFESFGWDIEFQDFYFNDRNLSNIIAKSSANPPNVIIGTHYDTRALSDNESISSYIDTPVPGANDGASGTAVLLEIGRVLKNEDYDIWFLFFDAEDQGYLNNWEWSIGAQYFVDQLEFEPENVIIIDMIGDSDLGIYKEVSSTPSLVDSIWKEAGKLGYESQFINDYKYNVIDDHLPFIKRGIPSCLIIDLDYPYWHTTKDTIDKISPESLEIVGNVLISWLSSHYQ